MGYNNIDRDDPRYDPSSMIVKVDDEEIEWIAISYGDDTDIALARAGGTSEVVGSGPGAYNPQGGSLRMHKDKAQEFLQALASDAIDLGANRVSAVPHTITVAYAEWNMPTIVDRIENVRFKGAQPGSAEGGSSTLAIMEIPMIFHRVKWGGLIHI